jgi:hypothetical protein
VWAKIRFFKTLKQIGSLYSHSPLPDLFLSLYKAQSQALQTQHYPWLKPNSKINHPKDFPLFLRDLVNSATPIIPISVVVTQNDDIVNPKFHGAFLESKGIPVHWLQGGYHCALSQSYPSEAVADFFALLLDTPKGSRL